MMDMNTPFIPSPPESPPNESPLSMYAYDGMPNAHTVLVLEPDNVRNATFRYPSSARSVYTVRTDERGDRTDVVRHVSDARDSAQILATIHRKAFSPSITLNGKRIPLRGWLNATMVGNSLGVTFESHDRTYQWRTNVLGNLALYEDNCTRPIAWFTRSRRSTATAGRAYLALEESAEALRDDIITSFLIVEETLRQTKAKVASY